MKVRRITGLLLLLWVGLCANTSFAGESTYTVVNKTDTMIQVNFHWQYEFWTTYKDDKQWGNVGPGESLTKSSKHDVINWSRIKINDESNDSWYAGSYVSNITLYYCAAGAPLVPFETCLSKGSEITIHKQQLPIPGGHGSTQECLNLKEQQDGTIANNGSASLIYQSDGNLVLYANINNSVLWSSETQGNPNGSLCYQGDGNLVVYDSNRNAKWDTFGEAGNSGYRNTQLKLKSNCEIELDASDYSWFAWRAGSNFCNVPE